MRTLLLPLCLLGVSATTTAAAPYEVSVEAACLAANDGFLSYRLTAPGARLGQDADVTRDIRTALSGCGLFEAPPGVSPDLLIEVTCGVGAPRREVRTETVPMPDESLGNPFAAPSPTLFITATRWVHVFPKFLTLSARAARSSQCVWRVHASITDESHEVEPVVSVLAAAAMNVVGRDTQGTATLALAADDADIRFILAGLDAGRN